MPTKFLNRQYKELERLNANNLTLKFEITVDFVNLRPHPIPERTHVTFKTTPSPFLVTDLHLLVNDEAPFNLIDGSISFINPFSILNYKAQF